MTHDGSPLIGEPTRGWCDHEVQQELPGLGLMFTGVEVQLDGSLTGSSTPAVKARLRELSGT